jgi:hypothetical protein
LQGSRLCLPWHTDVEDAAHHLYANHPAFHVYLSFSISDLFLIRAFGQWHSVRKHMSYGIGLLHLGNRAQSRLPQAMIYVQPGFTAREVGRLRSGQAEHQGYAKERAPGDAKIAHA